MVFSPINTFPLAILADVKAVEHNIPCATTGEGSKDVGRIVTNIIMNIIDGSPSGS